MTETSGSVKRAFEQGERWTCDNDNCGAEIIVITHSKRPSQSKPRCSCGGNLSKPYIAPGVRKLDSQGADLVLQRLELLKKSEP